MVFRLTFLGTSSGIPTKRRNVSALAVECLAQNAEAKNQPWILVDCGEGTQHQLLKSKLSLTKLVAILVTHVHGDHCLGLMGLLASLSMHGRKEPLTIIAPQVIEHLLEVTINITQSFLSYPLNFLAIEDLLAKQQLGDCYSLPLGNEHRLEVNITTLSHRCPSYAFELVQYIKKQQLNIQALTQLQIDKRHWRSIFNATQNIAMRIDGIAVYPFDMVMCQETHLKIVIAGDNDKPELLIDMLKDATLLVHEATYTDDIRQKVCSKLSQKTLDPQHSSVKMVAQVAQKVGVQALALTHFSARYASFEDICSCQPNMAHIRQEACQYYQGQLILAEDFLRLLVKNDGSVAVL